MNIDTFYFCPRCHTRVILPDFVKTANVQGAIKLSCNNCKKGKIVIENKKEKKG